MGWMRGKAEGGTFLKRKTVRYLPLATEQMGDGFCRDGKGGAEQPRGREEFSYGCVGMNAEQVGCCQGGEPPSHGPPHGREDHLLRIRLCPLPQNSYAEVLITQYLKRGLYLEKRPLRS